MAEGKIFSEQRLHFWSVTESYHFALENLESSTSFVWTITSGQPIYISQDLSSEFYLVSFYFDSTENTVPKNIC